MSEDLDQAFANLEEAQAMAARRKEKGLSLQSIPTKVEERHGLFYFEGYVARSRVFKCLQCQTERVECVGIFSREHHELGGFRYTVAKAWPVGGKPMRHEIQRVAEPYCYLCVQEFGFSEFEDHGDTPFSPLFKVIEEGTIGNFGTNRIVPQSVQACLQKLAEKPATRASLDADEMLDELGDL